MKSKHLYLKLIVSFLGLILLMSFVLADEPSGAEVDPGNSSRMNVSEPGSTEAQAGNLSELNLFVETISKTWQGYFGNVSGTIRLGDSSGKMMYNWSLINPRGQVYASTNETIEWVNIQCFNFTAAGTFDDDTGNAGNTSLYGLNVTQLHEMFNVPNNAADSVNGTFNHIGPGGHKSFEVGLQEFSEGQCQSTWLFNETGEQSEAFDNILLYEPETRSLIFTAIIEQGLLGFDEKPYDFQMLVIDDGRTAPEETTTYFFFAELL